ncbi:NB-ARC domain containing protein [Nitzschia inconspicua]|uniref:NB-ARC domain containing protein n=1 Tax=Nitzschia inconspicua TaxID=303405 RepID=A0A9K3Q6T8_9STRA|nr:NB-ARC domain containing protein [Nitzschia inconspicua]
MNTPPPRGIYSLDGTPASRKEDARAAFTDILPSNVSPISSIFQKSKAPPKLGQCTRNCNESADGIFTRKDSALSSDIIPRIFQDKSALLNEWKQQQQNLVLPNRGSLAECIHGGRHRPFQDLVPPNDSELSSYEPFNNSPGLILTARSVMVMQASPLACKLKHVAVTQRIEELNLQSERDVLSRIFLDHRSTVSIKFKIATIESLGDFFRDNCQRPSTSKRSDSPVLHLSCHGERTFLALEDGKGTMQRLSLDILQEWLRNTSIKLVFVAACYSKSIGDLISASGVDHVICAADDDTEVQSAYVLEFCKVFYKRLLSGDTVRESFFAAKIHSEAFDSVDSQLLLIGSHIDHDVPIFYAGTPPSSPETAEKLSCSGLIRQQAKQAQRDKIAFGGPLLPPPPAYRYNGSTFKPSVSHTSMFSVHMGECDLAERLLKERSTTSNKVQTKQPPPIERDLQQKHAPPIPPEYYVRCDDEKYQILRALDNARIVWISGKEPKCGKTTVVQSSLCYLQYRLDSNNLDAIFWGSKGTLEASKSDFYDLLDTLRKVPSGRFLVAIEAKGLPECTSRELSLQVRTSIRQNPKMKFIVVHELKDGEALQVGTYDCSERSVLVGGLNPESTVKLFGRICPHVTNEVEAGIHGPESLWESLAPNDAASFRIHGPRRTPVVGFWTVGLHPSTQDHKYSARFRILLGKMGGSIPVEVIRKAKHITADEYQQLLCLGRYHELDHPKYVSYYELVKLQLQVAQCFVSSIRRKSFEEAMSIQMKHDCISMVKSEVKNLVELRNELKTLRCRMVEAKNADTMDHFASLFQKRNRLWKRIQHEVNSILGSTAAFKSTEEEVVLDFCCSRQELLEDLLRYVQDVFFEASIRRCLFSTDNYVESKLVKAEKLLFKVVTKQQWMLDLDTVERREDAIERYSLSTIDEDGEKNDSSFSQRGEESDVEEKCPTTETEKILDVVATSHLAPATDPPVELLSNHCKGNGTSKETILGRHSSSRTLTTVGTTASEYSSHTDRTNTDLDWRSPLQWSTSNESSSGSGLHSCSAVSRKSSSSSISLETMSTTRSSCQSKRGIKNQNSMTSYSSNLQLKTHEVNSYDEDEAGFRDNQNDYPTKCVSRRRKKKSRDCCRKELRSRVFESLQSMTCQTIARKHDQRWQTGASNAPKDLQLPTVRRYSPPPNRTEPRRIKRHSMVRD